MENRKAIEKQHTENAEQIKALNAKINAIVDGVLTVENLKAKAAGDATAAEKIRKGDDEIKAAQEKVKELTLINKYLKDNARQALFAEVMPVIKAEFAKFAGKPYGEKTAEKIKSAIKARTNCAVYIERGYIEQLHIIPLNEQGYSNCTGYGSGDFDIYPPFIKNEGYIKMLPDNKINIAAFDNMKLSNCKPYNDDIPGTIEELKDAFAAIQEAAKNLEEAAAVFNSLKPSSVDHIPGASVRNYIA